jgi:hypothetical protein
MPPTLRHSAQIAKVQELAASRMDDEAWNEKLEVLDDLKVARKWP